MRFLNKIIDFALYVGTIPLLCVGLFALIDARIVSTSAAIGEDLAEMAEEDGDGGDLFDRLDAESGYVVAWLTIFGTNISYPVAQTEDNSWFLNRNYKGEFATAGSLFLDYRNNSGFRDSFSIIYGHRMGNGEMFSDIHKFKDDAFFDGHGDGILKTRGGDHALKVMSYAEVRADDWGIYNVGRSRNSNEVVEYIISQSEIIREDIEAGRYLLLSTCDGEEKNKRDVLLVGIGD